MLVRGFSSCSLKKPSMSTCPLMAVHCPSTGEEISLEPVFGYMTCNTMLNDVEMRGRFHTPHHFNQNIESAMATHTDYRIVQRRGQKSLSFA